MFNSSVRTTDAAWRRLRRGLTILYLVIALILLFLSVVGNYRLLSQVGRTFTWDLWLESYGLTFIAGLCWIVVGFILLARAQNWTGVVEGITLLPVAILFLLFSYWGNVQQGYPADLVFQFLWTPAFALLGAAFIQLSLTYRPEAMRESRSPRLAIDILPYLPLIALLAFAIFSYLFRGSVPGRLQFMLSLGYAVFGGVLSLVIDITSLLRISVLLHADAHLRSLLSQRIHDQPKQQALRIRSLLGHWQYKLRVEAEQNPTIKNFAQPIIEALGKVRKISEELEGDLRGLQLLVEDAYQRRNLGLKLHLEKLIREDLPTLHAESLLKIQPDLWALDELSHDLEQTEPGIKFAEAISYTVTKALLYIYNHAVASFEMVRAIRTNGFIE